MCETVCDEQLRGTFFPADGSVAVGMSLADFESGCKGDEMRPGRFVRIAWRIVGGDRRDARVHARHCHTRAGFCLRLSAHVALIITSCTSPGASALKPSTSAPDSLGSPVSSFVIHLEPARRPSRREAARPLARAEASTFDRLPLVVCCLCIEL